MLTQTATSFKEQPNNTPMYPHPTGSTAADQLMLRHVGLLLTLLLPAVCLCVSLSVCVAVCTDDDKCQTLFCRSGLRDTATAGFAEVPVYRAFKAFLQVSSRTTRGGRELGQHVATLEHLAQQHHHNEYSSTAMHDCRAS